MSSAVSKFGFQLGVQRYRCYSCGRIFQGGIRIDLVVLWEEYTVFKQTYKQLASFYGVSVRTIQRYINKHTYNSGSIPKLGRVVVLLDTTYFGSFGLMLFRDFRTGVNLYWKFVSRENVTDYMLGISKITEAGNIVEAIVCDGFKGLFFAFGDIPVQMCHFHQGAIIRRYLTSRPKLAASRELREIAQFLKKTDKESFFGLLSLWYDKWKVFLNERSQNPITGKSHYVHKRLRSAYRSLNYNKDWLFTWYDHYELGIPKTNNQIEGSFTALKNNLRNHNGLSAQRKSMVISGFLEASILKIKKG